jgi:hypothetical protein
MSAPIVFFDIAGPEWPSLGCWKILDTRIGHRTGWASQPLGRARPV